MVLLENTGRLFKWSDPANDSISQIQSYHYSIVFVNEHCLSKVFHDTSKTLSDLNPQRYPVRADELLLLPMNLIK